MPELTTLQTISIFLQSILVAVVIVAVVLVWRWLKVALNRGELQAQNEALAQLTVYAKIFVNAAEQTMAKQPGFAKLNWVLEQFDDVLPDLDKTLIRSVVEATVRSMPKTLQLAAPPATMTTFTGTPSSPSPPDPVAATVAPPATSHSHRNSKSRVSTEG